MKKIRHFFKVAIKRDLLHKNPFEEIPATVQANLGRFYYVSREETQAVLDACPDAQWRLIVALARYGSLRMPTEVQALRWRDVDWAKQRIRVPSPKTEHMLGRASRMMPLFPELLPHLQQAFDEAEEGTEHVITRYRVRNCNLRTQLNRIIERAGLEPWPKLFQNQRSTRETELAEQFPLHVVCRWIGNSEPVATQHYLQMVDEHFDRAVKRPEAAEQAAQNAAQQSAAEPGTAPHDAPNEKPQTSENTDACGSAKHESFDGNDL